MFSLLLLFVCVYVCVCVCVGGWGLVGREDPNITQNGPSSARQRNAIEMAFRWRTDDGSTLTAGLVFDGIRTSISRKP